MHVFEGEDRKMMMIGTKRKRKEGKEKDKGRLFPTAPPKGKKKAGKRFLASRTKKTKNKKGEKTPSGMHSWSYRSLEHDFWKEKIILVSNPIWKMRQEEEEEDECREDDAGGIFRKRKKNRVVPGNTRVPMVFGWFFITEKNSVTTGQSTGERDRKERKRATRKRIDSRRSHRFRIRPEAPSSLSVLCRGRPTTFQGKGK